MRLFHITNRHHVQRILADGVINVTESNIGAPHILSMEAHVAAARAEGPDSEPPLVMVWSPNDKTEALTIPRNILHKAEQAGLKFDRLTPKEVEKETRSGDPTYKAKVVLNFVPDQIVDGKEGDVLQDTEVPASEEFAPYGEHYGPDVVWLTRDSTPRQEWAKPIDHDWEEFPEEYRKDTVLMVVDIPDDEVHKWSVWAFEQGINPAWYDRLTYDSDDHENWYVVPRPIPMSEWVGVWDLRTGQVGWLPPGTYDVPMPEAWIPTRLKKVT